MAISSLELKFDLLWDYLYPDIDLVAEYQAIKGRKYKFDYAHLSSSVLIEIQGQIWRTGGHNTGNGLLRDYEKYNLAQAQGFVVFQLSDEMISDYWLEAIAATIKNRAN